MLITKNKLHTLPPKKTKSYFKWYVLGFVLLLAAITFIFTNALFEKSVQKNKMGEITDISEKQKEKFRADSAKLANCVQYVIFALESKFYPRCEGTGLYYLHKGEVWKYGVTCESNPNDRYPKDFLSQNKLSLVPQFSGNRFECEVEERRKLYYYPILPENLQRPANEKLILPIGNCKHQ